MKSDVKYHQNFKASVFKKSVTLDRMNLDDLMQDFCFSGSFLVFCLFSYCIFHNVIAN